MQSNYEADDNRNPGRCRWSCCPRVLPRSTAMNDERRRWPQHPKPAQWAPAPPGGRWEEGAASGRRALEGTPTEGPVDVLGPPPPWAPPGPPARADSRTAQASGSPPSQILARRPIASSRASTPLRGCSSPSILFCVRLRQLHLVWAILLCSTLLCSALSLLLLQTDI